MSTAENQPQDTVPKQQSMFATDDNTADINASLATLVNTDDEQDSVMIVTVADIEITPRSSDTASYLQALKSIEKSQTSINSNLNPVAAQSTSSYTTDSLKPTDRVRHMSPGSKYKTNTMIPQRLSPLAVNFDNEESEPCNWNETIELTDDDAGRQTEATIDMNTMEAKEIESKPFGSKTDVEFSSPPSNQSGDIRRCKSMSELSKQKYGDAKPYAPSVLKENEIQANEIANQKRRNEAATVIQHFYRLRRMQRHFLELVNNVQKKKMDAMTKEQRRMSLVLWAMQSTLSRSNSAYNSPEMKQRKAITSTPELLLPFQQMPNSNNSTIFYDSAAILSSKLQIQSHESLPYSPNASNNNLSMSSDGAEPKDVVEQERKKRRYINEFNIDPQKGVDGLIKYKMIQASPESIAKFLLAEEKLSKTKIGEYLGQGNETAIKVLKQFVQQLDFAGLGFDQALRKLLRTFRLPGEAQKIDRIVNEFAKRYCENNPTSFSNGDTAYVLAYSLIMLNTDAHNPAVKKKMTLADFIKNNRGIDNGRDLPESMLQALFANIVKEEIKMNEFDNVYKIQEVCAQISGKVPNLAQPHRRFIQKIKCHQIPDIFKPNSRKHERVIFLFNDLILVTKPRGSNPTVTAGLSQSDQDNIALANRYEHRYTFNFVEMKVENLLDNVWHSNVVELVNPNGRLITVGFSSIDLKNSFMKIIQELIEEIQDLEEEKKTKLHSLTISRVTAAKSVLEKKYNEETGESSSPIQKYGTLRNARLALKAQSRFMAGKKAPADAPPQDPLLASFAVQVRLESPSACPYSMYMSTTNEDIDTLLDLPAATPSATSGRRRRNTITGAFGGVNSKLFSDS